MLRLVHFLLLMIVVMANTRSAAAQSFQAQMQQAIQQAVTTAEPAIVRIETVGGMDVVSGLLTATGPTTGVVVHPDGYIITSSFNFISNPASIVVSLPDDRKLAAEVVSQDQSKMLTLLKVDATGLPTLTAVPKAEMQVGQTAIALGRTFDARFPNVSTGIISAKDRVWGRAVQTDAKVSPVNYGGALVDLQGRCLGVLVPLSPQKQGETAGVEWYDSGIGFAVPLVDIESVLDRMMEGETLHAGLMGVGFSDVGVATKPQVARVTPESPADKVGLLEDDIITAVNGESVARLAELKHKMGMRYAGETVKLTVMRGDSTLDVELKLVESLPPWEFAQLGIMPERTGNNDAVGIRYVTPDSAAATAGLQVGDRITKLGDDAITSTSQLLSIISRIKPETDVSIAYQRGEESKSVSFKLEPLSNAAPADLPPADIVKPEGEVTGKLGRLNEKVPGGDGSFWGYVHEDYHPEVPQTLLVFVHPGGDTMEAEMLRNWKSVCQERGILLVAPRAADISGWASEDEDFVAKVVEWMRERYTIDPLRICVMGQADSGVFAARLSFKYRETYRGLLMVNSMLRFPPPDSDPDYRLLIGLATAEDSPAAEANDQLVKALQARKFPTQSIALTAEELTVEDVASLAEWVDAIDRL